jgi:hypothetical protein
VSDVGDAAELVVTLGAFITALAAAVVLLSRVVESALGRALCTAFIAVVIALTWWFSRWFGDSCSDQGDLGGCADLKTAFTVIGAVWITLVVLACGMALRNALGGSTGDPTASR